MSYGQPAQGPPYGPPPGPPQGRPQGQPGYGQGAPLPPYGPPPTRQDTPQRPPQEYAPPQHQAPPGRGRPSRRARPAGRPDQPGQRDQPGQYDQAGQYGQPGQYGPPGPYAGVPVPGAPGAPGAPGREPRPERVVGGLVSDDDERWAVPAYVGMFVSGFVAPAIVLLVKGRTSNFARFHAAQALNLFVAVFTVTFVTLVLFYLKGLDWLPLVLLVLGADCFITVWAAIRANRCEWYRLPAIVAPRIFR